MQNGGEHRRGFIRRLAAIVGGLTTLPVWARPARAGHSRSRARWGGFGYGGIPYGGYGGIPYGGYGGIPYGGYGGRRGGSSARRRFYPRAIPYGGYGGYGGYAPYPYRGGIPGGGIYTPLPGGFGPSPYYNGGGAYPPVLKLQKSRVGDPLALLEC